MFTETFLATTNPTCTLRDLFAPAIFTGILISVVFHTTMYASFVNLVHVIFCHKFLSQRTNVFLVSSLLAIMSLGFLARFFHVKDIYRAYAHDMQKTRAHLDQLYITWLFIS